MNNISEKYKKELMEIYQKPLYRANIKDCFYLRRNNIETDMAEANSDFNFIYNTTVIEDYLMGDGLNGYKTIVQYKNVEEIEKEANPNEIYVIFIHTDKYRMHWRDEKTITDYEEIILGDKELAKEMKNKCNVFKRPLSIMKIDLIKEIYNKDIITLYMNDQAKEKGRPTLSYNTRMFHMGDTNQRCDKIIHWLSFFLMFYDDIQKDKSDKVYSPHFTIWSGKYKDSYREDVLDTKYFIVKNNKKTEVEFDDIRNL